MGITVACNLPAFATQEPFVFPTPEYDNDSIICSDFGATYQYCVQPQQLRTQLESSLADSNGNQSPTHTNTHKNINSTYSNSAFSPDQSTHRSSICETSTGPDGGWGDWVATEYSANYVVWGDENWKNSDDLSSSIMVEWDEDYLYVAWKVFDDKYVQISTGDEIYLGDSVEVLLDTFVQADYWYQYIDWDDFQIGVSPGKTAIGNKTQAYIWYPSNKTGSTTKVIIGTKAIGDGYRVTIGIPWKTLGVTPYVGAHYGFAASVSDDDSKHGGEQQSMVSSSPYRILTDPTTWGDLVLVK